VTPSRVARSSRVYTSTGRFNLDVAASRRDFGPIDPACDCYTCAHYSRAYLHHLFRTRELLSATLATIHNEHFFVRLVDRMRESIDDGTFADLKADVLSRFYGDQ